MLCQPEFSLRSGICGQNDPTGGVSCTAERVIAEPDCNCSSTSVATAATEPVKGYADLHLHMFGNLAFGGMTLWGDAFDKPGGISRALRADAFAQRTADRVINGNVIEGINGTAVGIDFFNKQTIVHGDFHANDLIGHGTRQHGILPLIPALANGGVEWNAALAKPPPRLTSWAGQSGRGRPTSRPITSGWSGRTSAGSSWSCSSASTTRRCAPAGDASTRTASRTATTPCRRSSCSWPRRASWETWLGEQCAGGVTTACALHQPADQKEGWFKVVTTPAMARSAIAKGQLAVVLGIEEATLFGCKAGVCTPDTVRTTLSDYYDLGVRHIFPIHNFDNGFGGAATWMDTIALGNAYSTTSYYNAADCPATPAFSGGDGYGFKLFAAPETDFLADIAQGLSRAFLGLTFFVRPTYPSLTTTCNSKGLSGLGYFPVREMMHKGMIIDVDHMSILALDRTLKIAEANAYPGIVASHVLMFELAEKSTRHERMRTKEQLQRIARVGGMIAAMTQPPDGAVIAPLNSKVIGGLQGLVDDVGADV